MKSILYNSNIKGKQADILRISSPIPSRPNKSMLAKSKFLTKINLQTWLLTPTTSYTYKSLTAILRKSSRLKMPFWNYSLTRLWEFITLWII